MLKDKWNNHTNPCKIVSLVIPARYAHERSAFFSALPTSFIPCFVYRFFTNFSLYFLSCPLLGFCNFHFFLWLAFPHTISYNSLCSLYDKSIFIEIKIRFNKTILCSQVCYLQSSVVYKTIRRNISTANKLTNKIFFHRLRRIRTLDGLINKCDLFD